MFIRYILQSLNLIVLIEKNINRVNDFGRKIFNVLCDINHDGFYVLAFIMSKVV